MLKDNGTKRRGMKEPDEGRIFFQTSCCLTQDPFLPQEGDVDE